MHIRYIEKEGMQKRSSISIGYKDVFLHNIMSQAVSGYTVEEIKRTRYQDRDIVSPEEAFAFMKSLIPCKENIFLFRENLHYLDKK